MVFPTRYIDLLKELITNVQLYIEKGEKFAAQPVLISKEPYLFLKSEHGFNKKIFYIG